MPARCASGPSVPALRTQQVVLPLLLQQQLVLVRAAWLTLHAHRDRCAQWTHHTYVMHARRVHLPRRGGSAHSQWDWASHGGACWPEAAGTRTALHTSLHARPTSHTVMPGATTGAKVSGVPEVPPAAGEAPPDAQSIVATDARFKKGGTFTAIWSSYVYVSI